MVSDATGLEIFQFLSGRLGGDHRPDVMEPVGVDRHAGAGTAKQNAAVRFAAGDGEADLIGVIRIIVGRIERCRTDIDDADILRLQRVYQLPLERKAAMVGADGQRQDCPMKILDRVHLIVPPVNNISGRK